MVLHDVEIKREREAKSSMKSSMSLWQAGWRARKWTWKQLNFIRMSWWWCSIAVADWNTLVSDSRTWPFQNWKTAICPIIPLYTDSTILEKPRDTHAVANCANNVPTWNRDSGGSEQLYFVCDGSVYKQTKISSQRVCGKMKQVTSKTYNYILIISRTATCWWGGNYSDTYLKIEIVIVHIRFALTNDLTVNDEEWEQWNARPFWDCCRGKEACMTHEKGLG